jgi:hypothetical protein
MARQRSRWTGPRLGLRLVFAVAAGSSGLGGGNRTELPTESVGGIIPASNTYRVKQVWQGFEGASDLILTSGSQVFVAFPDQGKVVGYFRTSPQARPNGIVIEGERPTFLAEGVDRELVIVDFDSTGCGVVRIFDLRSVTEVATFCDTTWAEVGGVAADDSAYVYISDREQNLVRKYARDGELVTALADEGSGLGYVQGPGGLEWKPDLLILADTGKGWVQGLDTRTPNTGLFFLNGAEGPLGPFVEITDVTGDDEGNLYVADSALGVVLKYAPGTIKPVFDQQVDQNAPEGSSGHLTEPIAISANATLAFVLDGDAGKIVTFELDR